MEPSQFRRLSELRSLDLQGETVFCLVRPVPGLRLQNAGAT